jgi:hypothetical protein
MLVMGTLSVLVSVPGSILILDSICLDCHPGLIASDREVLSRMDLLRRIRLPTRIHIIDCQA